MIVWLTGQSGAGKTTVGLELARRFNCQLVDGDELRDIFKNKVYTREGRYQNIRRAQDIARFLNHKDRMVVVALVSPYRELREELKAEQPVLEVYLHTTEQRKDPKFQVADYEVPLENFVSIDTTNRSIDRTVDFIANIRSLLGYTYSETIYKVFSKDFVDCLDASKPNHTVSLFSNPKPSPFCLAKNLSLFKIQAGNQITLDGATGDVTVKLLSGDTYIQSGEPGRVTQRPWRPSDGLEVLKNIPPSLNVVAREDSILLARANFSEVLNA